MNFLGDKLNAAGSAVKKGWNAGMKELGAQRQQRQQNYVM
jgi:hypothetical protein